MLLAINIGNTSIWFGVFEKEKLLQTFRLESKGNIDIQRYQQDIKKHVGKNTIHEIVISSVVPPHHKVFEQICKQLFHKQPLFVHDLINPNILKIKIRKNAGEDILCNAVAVKTLYGYPSVVIDLGTATTFDAVNQHGEYVGSAISPGMQTAHQALVAQTALLHEIPLKAPKSVIGIDTTTAIQSGVVLGYVSLIEGMAERFKKELGENTKFIATGGLATIIAKYTTLFTAVDPHLTLRGIHIVSKQKTISRAG